MFTGVITFCAVFGMGDAETLGECRDFSVGYEADREVCDAKLDQMIYTDPGVELYALEMMEEIPQAVDIDIVWGCLEVDPE